MNCKICGNRFSIRKVFLGNIGPLGARKYGKETYCYYCEWKGTSGPGAELRKAIEEHNSR